MSRFTFPESKGFKRAKDHDFSDDGTRFTAYIYKDSFRVTSASWQGEIFVSIRLPLSWDEMKNADMCADPFNGVNHAWAVAHKEEFYALCEELYTKLQKNYPHLVGKYN